MKFNGVSHHSLLAAAAIAAALLMGSCAKKEGNAPAAANEPTEAEKAQAAQINIRYIDSDSVMAGYELAKEFQELTLNQLNRLESTRQARQAELQKLGQQIEQKMRNNGYLTQESYEADMRDASKKEQSASSQLANMERQAQTDAMQRQAELNDSIVSFIKDYNAEKGYDAILFKGAGVWFNPALDITDEVLKGLNERYAKSKKK